jgi:hypothetical protein
MGARNRSHEWLQKFLHALLQIPHIRAISKVHPHGQGFANSVMHFCQHHGIVCCGSMPVQSPTVIPGCGIAPPCQCSETGVESRVRECHMQWLFYTDSEKSTRFCFQFGSQKLPVLRLHHNISLEQTCHSVQSHTHSHSHGGILKAASRGYSPCQDAIHTGRCCATCLAASPGEP